jgi:hypothetical protein
MAGMTTLTPGPAARSAEITRYPAAAERASVSSATGIAVRSAMESNSISRNVRIVPAIRPVSRALSYPNLNQDPLPGPEGPTPVQRPIAVDNQGLASSREGLGFTQSPEAG